MELEATRNMYKEHCFILAVAKNLLKACSVQFWYAVSRFRPRQPMMPQSRIYRKSHQDDFHDERRLNS